MTDWQVSTVAGSGGTSSAAAAPVPDLPIRLWGLDPLYWSYVKLPIALLLRLTPFPDLPDTYQVNGHPLSKVEVVGTVVSRKIKQKMTIYGVDDGSGGVMKCTAWYNPKQVASEAEQSVLDSLRDRDQMAVGALIRLRGRLQSYRNAIEISVEQITAESDLNSESLHWLEQIAVYERVYSKPAPLISKLQSAAATPSASGAVGSAAPKPTVPHIALADACVAHIKSTVKQVLIESEIRKSVALRGVAEHQLRRAAATASSVDHKHSTASAASAPVLAVAVSTIDALFTTAIQHLQKTGQLLLLDREASIYELFQMEKHLTPAIGAVVRADTSGGGVRMSAIISGVRKRYPHVAGLDDAVPRTVEQLCEASRMFHASGSVEQRTYWMMD